jgi:hypothetical protein
LLKLNSNSLQAHSALLLPSITLLLLILKLHDALVYTVTIYRLQTSKQHTPIFIDDLLLEPKPMYLVQALLPPTMTNDSKRLLSSGVQNVLDARSKHSSKRVLIRRASLSCFKK